MKVLQINCVYRKGSTGKIVYDLHRGLVEHGIDSVVCYGRGKKWKEPGVYKTCGELYAKANHLRAKLTGLMYGGCYYSTHRLIRVIKREQPDVVHLHCINGYFVNIYKLITWLNQNKIRTVLTLHAEFPFTANCGYALDCERWKTGCGHCHRLHTEIGSFLFDRTHSSWEKMRRAYVNFDALTVVSVSGWLMERAKQSVLLSKCQHTVIKNGIDVSVFQPYRADELRRELGLTAKKVALHVTAGFYADPDHVKGGYQLLKLAREMPDVEFYVAGRYEEGLDIPKNLHLLGPISDQKRLAQLYAMADVTVLTSKRETFSMPVAESLCCGTPVVGFEAGGPEEIAIQGATAFVPYGDIAKLREKLYLFLDKKEPWIRAAAVERYSSEKIVSQYLQIYRGDI